MPTPTRSDLLCDLGELRRTNVASLRKTMRRLGVVVAEVDLKLRYVWVDNPHPDFDAAAVVGKRDDELISKEEARGIMELKKEASSKRQRVARVLQFNRSDGVKNYHLSAYPLMSDDASKLEGLVTLGFETST